MFPMHMGVPQACRNTSFFIGTSLIFKFCPSLSQKTTLRTAQKPKGGPSDEKTIFFKNVLQSLSNMIKMTAFVVRIPKTYKTWGLSTLQGLCTLCACFKHCARSVHMSYRLCPCYVCFWNQHTKCSHFKHVLKRLEKIVFSTKGSPFGFWAVCKVFFWPREGQNLKISEVPIK